MNLSGLVSFLDATPEFKALLARLRATEVATTALETLDAARPYVLAALHAQWHAPIVIATARVERAKQLWTDLTAWSAAPERIYFFAEPDPLLYERMPWSEETLALRLAALSALSAPLVSPPLSS